VRWLTLPRPPGCLSPRSPTPLTTVRTLCALADYGAVPPSAVCAVACGADRTRRRQRPTCPTAVQPTVGAVDQDATGSDASTSFYTKHTYDVSLFNFISYFY